MKNAYWSYSVFSHEARPTTHEHEEEQCKRCLVSTGKDTIGEAFASMYSDLTYYQSECGYTVSASIDMVCATCFGRGEVPKNRVRYEWKVCPDCKGRRGEHIDIPIVSNQYVTQAPG